MTMKLDNTKYIVEDLIAKGLVTSDNKDKVSEVIAAGGETNKEYQTKKWIIHYLEYYSGSLIEEADVNAVYSTIKSKYKEDFKLDKEQIRFDVLSYLKKENKFSNSCVNVTESLDKMIGETLKGFTKVGYYRIL